LLFLGPYKFERASLSGGLPRDNFVGRLRETDKNVFALIVFESMNLN